MEPTNTHGIFAAMTAIMREVEAIGKGRQNVVQGYKFRGIDDVYNALNPLLAKHGVFTVPEVQESKREERTNAKGTVLFYSIVTMRYTFFASDGSSVQAVVIGEGMDSGDKATNKAMAVAHKYALLQIFAIPTEEPKDPEVESHEVVRKPPSVGGGEAKRGDRGVETPPVQTGQGTPAESSLHEAIANELGGERIEQPAKEPAKKHPTKGDVLKLDAERKKRSIALEVVKTWLKDRYKVAAATDLTMEQYDELRNRIIPGIDKGTIMPLDLTVWPNPLANEERSAA